MGAVGYTGGDPSKVDVIGDTMTGPLVLPGDPVSDLQAATKQYVDNNGGGGGGGGIPATTVTSETSFGITPAVGTGTKYARDDHTHGSPTAPTAASVGASPSGHAHAGVYDPAGSAATAQANAIAAIPAAGGTVVTEQTYGQSSTAGAATSYSRADHTHGTPSAVDVSGKVTGPASATDNAVARFDLTTGKLLQNSLVIVDDTGGVVLTPISSPAYAAGRLVYDADNQCVTFYNDNVNVSMQVGQELWLRVRNISGSSIGNGIPVYISGASAGLPTIVPANANAIGTVPAAGLTTEVIANNTNGYVTIAGVVNGLDTSAFAAGAQLYVGTTAGTMTATAPASPNYRNRVGSVMSVNATTGQILVTPGAAVLGFGSANQVLGMNAAATAQEHKTVAGTTNRLTVTQGVGTITLDVSATLMALYATLASPTFTGTPTLPTGTVGVTQTAGNSTTALATTAFVTTADNLKANLASPTFTGTPAAPTAAALTNTTQLATTAFVTTADNLKADLASPTLTGTPAAPTAAPGTNTTQLATTAFVTALGALKANLASPTFTGTPTLPTGTVGVTQTVGDNTTALATTAFVQTAAGLLVPKSLYAAKGTIAVASAASTPAALAVGADTFVLTADSAQSTGVKWAAAAGGGGTDYKIASKPKTGLWYRAPSFGPVGSNLSMGTLARCYFVPFRLAASTTFDRIGVDVATAGTATAVLRLGIYSPDAAGDLPGTLILDAGTVAGDSTGAKQATISQLLAAGMYWLCVANQVASGTVLRAVVSYDPLLIYTSGASMFTGTTAPGAVVATSITGAFASNPTISDNDNGPIIGMRAV